MSIRIYGNGKILYNNYRNFIALKNMNESLGIIRKRMDEANGEKC